MTSIPLRMPRGVISISDKITPMKKKTIEKEVSKILTPKKQVRAEVLELELTIKGIRERTGLAGLEAELERKREVLASMK